MNILIILNKDEYKNEYETWQTFSYSSSNSI